MTDEEISKWLTNLKNDICQSQYQPLWHYAEALDMAIKALEEQKRINNSFSISVYDKMPSRFHRWVAKALLGWKYEDVEDGDEK